MFEYFQDTLTFFSPDFFIAHCVMIFIFGLFFGSFLNVCIYRIPLGQSIVYPGSHCFSCGLPIVWHDNIPLLSYIVLRGRCRKCGSSYSPRYFLIELLTGLLYLAIFIKFRYHVSMFFYIVFVSSLIVATFTDIDHWIIPDRISIGGFIFASVISLFALWIAPTMIIVKADPFYPYKFYHPFLNALIGAGTGFFILWFIGFVGSIIFKKEAMGWGDIKLFAYIGAVLGVFNTVLVLSLSSMIGAIFGVSAIIASKMSGKASAGISGDNKMEEQGVEQMQNQDGEEENSPRAVDDLLGKLKNIEAAKTRSYHQLPFGPYICVAAILILFFHDKIDNIINSLFMM